MTSRRGPSGLFELTWFLRRKFFCVTWFRSLSCEDANATLKYCIDTRCCMCCRVASFRLFFFHKKGSMTTKMRQIHFGLGDSSPGPSNQMGRDTPPRLPHPLESRRPRRLVLRHPDKAVRSLFHFSVTFISPGKNHAPSLCSDAADFKNYASKYTHVCSSFKRH